jgi:hypothetical protein
MRAPSTPSGASTSDISSTTTGPRYQSTCATPLCLPRAPAGAISAISDQEAGMSAPTARPTITKPATIIHGCEANTSHSMPKA